MPISNKKLMELYRGLVVGRMVDQKLMDLFSAGKLPMPWLHRRPGEEAPPVAICAALRPDDYFEPNQFSFYMLFAKGFSIRDVIASECMRDPAMHGGQHSWWCPERGIFGFTGSLGETIPIFNGCAVASKLLKTGQVTVDCFGDGQSSRGPIHESLVMAGFLNLPIIFGLHYNQYAIGQPASELFRMKDKADFAKPYAIPAETVDGNDVIACYEVTKKYVDRARKGGGPALIVYNTFRMRGHAEGDKQQYRPKGEVEEWWKLDPIPRMQKYLLKNKIVTAADIKKLDKEWQAEVDVAAQDEALAMPELDFKDYMKDTPIVDTL